MAVAGFEHVTKRYPVDLFGHRFLDAVREVSFRVEQGEVFGLLGPNRAGKTTLVKLLLSLCRPTSGRVERLGKPVSHRPSLGRVGYVHENQAFPRYLTANDLLEYYGALTHMPEPEVRRRVPALLEQVGLADRSHEPISRFSKGMIQRLDLAQALLNDPDLLVLDEPSEGLDLAGRQLVRDVVRQRREQGKTVLLVTHLLSEAERLCERVAVILAGRMAYLGPLAELTRHPATGEPRSLEEAMAELYAQPQT
jgi:ABC-2 type transport system ATP-binding protein